MKKITADVFTVGSLPKRAWDQLIDWMKRGMPLNMFDPNMLLYPRTVICTAKADDENLLFIPLQPVLMYDAIASAPDITPRQEALALYRIGQVTDRLAKDLGFRETYFFCRDNSVTDLCADHGFEEVKNVRVLRRKIPEE
jgi:hypothetical protein